MNYALVICFFIRAVILTYFPDAWQNKWISETLANLIQIFTYPLVNFILTKLLNSNQDKILFKINLSLITFKNLHSQTLISQTIENLSSGSP